VLRRRALNVAAREAGADKLATAHNLDDETQTILLNLLHGDALRIARVNPVLAMSHPKLVQRVKPLCEVPEKEIAFYAFKKGCGHGGGLGEGFTCVSSDLPSILPLTREVIRPQDGEIVTLWADKVEVRSVKDGKRSK
jgi:glucosamine 6-phosphate synthetase-like amidotransferase/phosphosugar isomerase protein